VRAREGSIRVGVILILLALVAVLQILVVILLFVALILLPRRDECFVRGLARPGLEIGGAQAIDGDVAIGERVEQPGQLLLRVEDGVPIRLRTGVEPGRARRVRRNLSIASEG
jgi:hypothetical protein